MGNNELLKKLNKIHNSKKEEIEEAFKKIAKEILYNYLLKINGNEYRITEIEFYYNDECEKNIHPDPYTHRHYRQRLFGEWYFHKKGRGGLDITFGKGKSYGGILLRSIIRLNDNEIIEGPSKIRNEIIKNITNIQNNKDKTSLIEEKEIFNPENLLQLENNKLQIEIKNNFYKAPRVGLQPDIDKPEWKDFIMKNYRYLLYPEITNNGKELLILSMIKNRTDNINFSYVLKKALVNYKTYYKAGFDLRKKNKKEKDAEDIINEINTNFGVYKKCKLYGLLNEGDLKNKN